jgi:hypothetical protein
MFVYILIGLALAAGLMLGLTWVRQKSEIIKKLRPTVESINHAIEQGNKGELPPAGQDENKIVRTVAEVPMQARKIEKTIDQGSERVAQAVIEFRARTVMVQQIAKAFFLPGLINRTTETGTELEKTGVPFKSPGYKMLVGKAEKDTSGNAVGASQIRALGSEDAEHEAARQLSETAGFQAPQAVQAIDRPQSDDAFIH